MSARTVRSIVGGLNVLACGVVVLVIGAASESVHGAPVDWAAWTSSTGPSVSGTAQGTIATSSGSVSVTYSGEIFFSQVNSAGIYYYAPDAPYLSATVSNAPPRADIIALQGGVGSGTHTLTFTPPVENPVMAIVSLGQPSIVVTYDFDVPFTILSYGPGYWGGPGTLNNIGGKRLTGVEGHGTIRFIGTVSSINWTIPNPETWHGFTVGLLGVAPCPCDLNGDGFVDDDDFVIFLAAYNILDCLDPSMPARCPADFNGDSLVDDTDFVIFVAAYNELVCP
ncbi:MAG: hypothetical protein KF691_01275 [Phycisphaeraceae bacterium]|nr:hypothetical protein [Phycisphaeraceae bacterium]